MAARTHRSLDVTERLNPYHPPASVVHGSEDNLARRVGGLVQHGFTVPDRMPTVFRQIGPESTGSDATGRRAIAYQGGSKFGNSRAYTGGD
jgi:hypothetical protein